MPTVWCIIILARRCRTNCPSVLACTIHGQKRFGTLNYWSKAEFRSDEDAYRSDVANLYEAGRRRTLTTFYRNATKGHFADDTVPRAVDSAWTCILGREAAARHAADDGADSG